VPHPPSRSDNNNGYLWFTKVKWILNNLNLLFCCLGTLRLYASAGTHLMLCS
jgi:hypothetical protein